MNKIRSSEELTCDTYNDDPTRVRRVARLLPGRTAFEDAAALLKIMADPTRACILVALSHEHLCVCELSTLLGMSTPAVSYHLKLLSLAGLIYAQKEGKFACYRLRDERVAGIISTLLHALVRAQPGTTNHPSDPRALYANAQTDQVAI